MSNPPEIPKKPSLDGLEAKWSDLWESRRIYAYPRDATRDDSFSIDTPPPTVSGSLHVGHVFSYTHTDVVARYQRMRGKQVFYPMGWDDNGLPTERRVQNYYGVQCDPSHRYDPDYRPAEPVKNKRGRIDLVPISRQNFIELCLELTAIDEQAFEDLFRRLGLSVDWSLTYTTIGEVARRVSQRAFLRIFEKGYAYQVEAPTLWDVDFQTAVAQAEVEDREKGGAFHRIRFAHESGPIEIDTTRPELIPACVALVAHPDDPRFQPLFGSEVTSPLFGVKLPIVAHELADPEKGTGVAMICTFGDVTDVIWWRELGLPVRAVIGRDGAFQQRCWGEPGWESGDVERAQASYDRMAGRASNGARREIVEMLRESGDLVGEPQPLQHAVKFYEKGDRPLEIVTSRQWFVRTLEHRDALLARGEELRWHPRHMGARYRAWVEGLNTDWCISRQRFFGVPFPLWYPIDDDGNVDHEHPIMAAESELPIDPADAVPPGYTEDQRGQEGGFIGDPDVMDTWATSSLSPQVATGWCEPESLFESTFPMDLRPQAHDIIRTWLFSTVVRAHYEHDSLPWTDAAISGWVLDPDRKKMSKSKGNVVTPIGLLETYGSDAVRYWSTSGRLGVDTAFDENQLKVGRRLAIKLLNAARFALSRVGEQGEVTAPIDRAMLTALADVVERSTADLEAYEHTRALERTETFFWNFCDNYLELVKSRSYGNEGDTAAASASRSLNVALSTLLRLLAPYLPFVTEEIWSWWQEGSVHRASWPDAAELRAIAPGGNELAFTVAGEALGEVRKAKTEAKVSLRAEVSETVVRDTAERLEALREAEGDLRGAGNIAALRFESGDAFEVQVTLAPQD